MEYKKIILSGLILLILFPIANTLAKDDPYYFKDKVTNTTSLFFLTDLQKEENIELSLTHEKDGEFELFLFDERPTKTYVDIDKNIEEEIYDIAVAYDSGDEPEIDYIAEKEKIFYIQVVLLDGGPDFLTLECNKVLTRYYLPKVPGFPLEILIVSMLFSLGIIVFIGKRKKICNYV